MNNFQRCRRYILMFIVQNIMKMGVQLLIFILVFSFLAATIFKKISAILEVSFKIIETLPSLIGGFKLQYCKNCASISFYCYKRMQFIVIYCYFIVINVIDLIVIKFVLKPGNWRQNGRIRGRIRKSLKMEAIFLGAIFFLVGVGGCGLFEVVGWVSVTFWGVLCTQMWLNLTLLVRCGWVQLLLLSVGGCE